MKTISAIKKDLEFNRGLSSLIEVLKTLAVAQYKALEHRLKTFEKYLSAIESFFELVDPSQVDHPFLRASGGALGVVAVTSDSGLLGGLNMQVVSHAISELEQSPGLLVVIGERGRSYVREGKIPYVFFSGIKDEERLAQAMQLRDYLMKQVLSGKISSLKVVYPRPVSFTVQRIETVAFLPFTHSQPQSPSEIGGPSAIATDVLLESDLSDILQYLVYLWMAQKLYEIFGLSRLAEFAARYVHLEESLQKLKEMDSKLKLQYFRVRHELIDRNMRELFSARLLYAQ